MMIVSFEIPDAAARRMHLDGPEAHRHALMNQVVEGYRSGALSRGQVSELLDLSLWETEVLLKERGCGLGVSAEEYAEDYEQARAFLGW